MPFPVEDKYIREAEELLDVKFPNLFVQRMKRQNGGNLAHENYQFALNSFFDKSNRKTIIQTCNHIAHATEYERIVSNLPHRAIVVGSDANGNLLILIHDGDGNLRDELYFYNQNDGSFEKIADSILDLESQSFEM